ncbi:MAG: efflux RND transporter periplasmic adaptor subunit [Chloroflexi bacterium]|nr:efflux RND transporter periplasmic adaptor subunit [Chloroflexota bacterium]
MAADSPTHNRPDPVAAPRRRRLVTPVLLLACTGAGVYTGMRWHTTFERWLRPSVANTAHSSEHQKSAHDAPEKKQLWTCGMHPQVIQDHPGDCPICHMKLTPLITGDAGNASSGPPATPATPAPPSGDRKIKYWHDPMMNPPYLSDRPGKSPMGMDLIPVYEDEAKPAGAAVTIDPAVVQNMGVRTVAVTQGPIVQRVRATAFIAEPETARTDINLRVSGWIQKLYANTEGMAVRKGDPLFDLYSPDLRLAIEELIAARRAQASGGGGAVAGPLNAADDSLIAAAQLRLRTLGLSQEQIDQLGAMEHAPPDVTFTSPINGVVVEKSGAFTGSAVIVGQNVMRLTDRSTMWVDARIPEGSLGRVRTGQPGRVRVDALAGNLIEGEVIFIHPNFDEMTRTALVRMAVPNPDGLLRAGMYAVAEIDTGSTDQVTIVPREAVIDTGEARLVFVSTGQGRFEPRRVAVGLAGSDGMIQIVSGVSPGEAVVSSGQFLLDSESRLREAIQKFLSKGAETGGQSSTNQPASPQEGSPSSGPATAPPARTPDPTAASPTVTAEQQQKADAALAEYLKLSTTLGAVQKSGAAPPPSLDMSALISAAHSLHGALSGTKQESLAVDLGKAAAALKDQPLTRQRELFSALGEKVIALADAVRPSKAVAGEGGGGVLYVMHCPMAPVDKGGGNGDWLQTTPNVANPFLGPEMKECGSLVRTITPREKEGKGK